MSIVTFHRILISCAILFCLWFGLRSAMVYTRVGGALDLALALGFIAAAAVLGWYLAHLKQILGRPSGR